MPSVDDLILAIGGDTAPLQKALTEAEKRMRASGQRLVAIGDQMSQTFSIALGALGVGSIKAFGEMERLRNGMTSMMGSAEAAADEIKKLQEVAKLPGVDFNQAAQGDIRLQAVGLSADQSRTAIIAFSNAMTLAGTSSTELDGVTLALSQIASKGKVSAEEINQLAERVPQIRQVMKNVFGTADTEQLQKMNIEANDFINRITVEMGKLPKATGGVANAIDNASQSVRTFLVSIGESINKAFNLEAAALQFSTWLEGIAASFAGLDAGTQKFIITAGALLVAVGPLLKVFGTLKMLGATYYSALGDMVGGLGKVITFAKQFTSVQAALNAVMALNPFVLAAAAIAAIGAAFYLAYQKSETFRNGVDALYSNVLKPVFDFLKTVGEVIIDVVVSIGTAWWDTYKAFAGVLVSIMEGIGSMLKRIPFVGDAIAWVADKFKWMYGVVKAIFANIPAFFAGLSAVARQIGKEIVGYFKGVGLQAQIIAKRMQLAMTFDDTASASLRKEIAALEAQKADAAAQGKTIGQAFSDAYAAALQKGIGDKPLPEPKKGQGPSKPPDDKQKPAPTSPGGGGAAKPVREVAQSMSETTTAATEAEIASAALIARMQSGVAPLTALGGKLTLVKSETEKYKGTTDALFAAFEAGKISIDELQQGLTDLNNTGLKPLDGISKKLTTAKDSYKLLTDELNAATATLKSNFAGIGDAIAATADDGATSLAEMGKAAMKSARMAVAAFIQTGVAAVIKDTLVKSGLGPLAIPLAAAAGGAAAALFNTAIAKIGVPAFANGGIVSGPTLAMVGEYPGASRNKEVIAPLSDLARYMPESSGNLSGDIRLRGNDLAITLARTQRGRSRIF